MAIKKLMIHDFYQMKHEGRKITWLTSYDFPTAQFAEAAGLDMLLVGDSLGMCVYGYPGTVPVTMDQCILHCDAVRRGAPNTFVIGDMPFLSYQVSDEKAVENAGRFLKEANVDAIKLEGGVRAASRIKAIVEAGILVVGHIGLTPQSSGVLGGHKAQGRTADAAKLVVEDALAVQNAGAQMILVEAVPPEVTRYIHQKLSIPVLSIGAGLHCDGQLADRQRSDRPVPGIHAQVRQKILQRGRDHHQGHDGVLRGGARWKVSRRRALLSNDRGRRAEVSQTHA